MASLMHANLPSEDEEDDDYDPSADPTGEKDPNKQQNSASRKRGRGLAVVDDAAVADGGTADDEQQPAARPAAAKEAVEAEEDVITPAQAANKAKISAMWDQLHQASTGSTNQLSKNSISLASLCSNTDPKKKKNTDVLWMRSLGLTSSNNSKGKSHSTPGISKAAAAASVADGAAAPSAPSSSMAPDGSAEQQQQQQQQQQQTTPPPDDRPSSIRAAAAAALAAAKEGATGGVVKSYNKVTVTETRRFAGQDIQVSVQVDKDSKEAKKAAERSAAAATGLDSFLKQIESKKKVTVLDKSKMDWQDFKHTDTDVQEELEAHRRSDKQYLDKQDFLKRAELREYEIERDKRLASDVRLRGRL